MNLRKKFLTAQAERKKKQIEANRKRDENYGTELSPQKPPKSPMSPKQAYGNDELIEEIFITEEPKPTPVELSLKWMLRLFEADSNLNIPLHKLGFLAIGWVIVFFSSIAKGNFFFFLFFDENFFFFDKILTKFSSFLCFFGKNFFFFVFFDKIFLFFVCFDKNFFDFVFF